MIRENLNIVQERLSELNSKCSLATQYLSKLEKAEEITTLTQEQIDAILAIVNTHATDISTAYNDLATAFQSTEAI